MNVLTWRKSYLTGRYQCVRVGQASSSHTLCQTGVPQGSVLGPILFSCYTSPISFIANTFIPISIKNCSSLYSFKRHLKSYFIAQLTNN